MKIKKLLKNKYAIIGVVVVVLIILSTLIFRRGDNGVTHITVEKKDITQAVLAAGKTKAVDSVDLGFEKSGKVTATYVDVGSRVVALQTLVLLDNSELQADLLKAQADLAEENAVNATDQIATFDALQNAKATISDSYTKADNAVGESVDQFFANSNTENSDFKPSTQNETGTHFYFTVDYSAKVAINKKRDEVKKQLALWKTEIDTFSENDIDIMLGKSETYLKTVKDLVDKVSAVIFSLSAPSSETSSIIAGYKSDMSTARTTVNTALSNLIGAREKLNTARAGETLANTGSDSVSAQNARQLQLQAQIQNIKSQIGKTIISAPFAGIVTKQEAEKGEIVTAGATIVSIISDNKLEIESNVSEVNIGKIVVGNPVAITLDAYPGESFTGTVSYIDPGETIVDSVVNYKVKIVFTSDVSKLKSGLTANLTIETSKKALVLAIPLFAVKEKAGKSFVQKVSGDSTTETEVTLGIIGQDGMVEVVSGLSLGETVEVGK